MARLAGGEAVASVVAAEDAVVGETGVSNTKRTTGVGGSGRSVGCVDDSG